MAKLSKGMEGRREGRKVLPIHSCLFLAILFQIFRIPYKEMVIVFNCSSHQIRYLIVDFQSAQNAKLLDPVPNGRQKEKKKKKFPQPNLLPFAFLNCGREFFHSFAGTISLLYSRRFPAFSHHFLIPDPNSIPMTN